MNDLILSEEQREALQEIANIGMGKAGRSIAAVFDEFVQLSIPRVKVTHAKELPAAVASLINEIEVTAVRQGFLGKLRGEAIVAYGMQGCRDLAELMGYEVVFEDGEEQELLLDVTNVIVGACLGGIAEQLRTEISFSAPSVLAKHVSPRNLLGTGRSLKDTVALLVEVNFKLERRSFSCNLLVLMPEDELETVRDALDTFIAEL